MKNAFNRFYLLVFFSLLFSACVEDVKNIDQADLKPKLVVKSFISPQDTILSVIVQKTQSVIGKEKNWDELYVINATVLLSDGSQEVQLQFNPNYYRYETLFTNLPIVAGKTYTLKVNTPDGYKALATCTVPQTTGIQVYDLQVESEKFSNNDPNFPYDYWSHFFTFKWKGNPQATNYYRTAAYHKFDNNGVPYEEAFYENQEVLTDENKNGQEFRSIFSWVSNSDTLAKPHYFYAQLLVTDIHYYRYFQSLQEQDYSGDNPFAEPTFVYSNVTGALGVFGAYNLIKEELYLP